MAAVDLSGPLKRRNYGKNHGYSFGDQKVPGVTTIKAVLDKSALKGWAAECAAEPVVNAAKVKAGELTVDGTDLWATLRELDDRLPVKPSLSKLADGLKWRHNKVRDVAANRGTEVHKLAERLTSGEEVEVPEALKGHVDAYIAWHEAWQPRDVLSEVAVGSRRYGGWGGTLDVIATIDVPGVGEVRALVDYKTSASGVYGDTAIQLAGYRFAEVMLDAAGKEQPMEQVDWCGVLWIRADGCDLYPFTVDERVFQLFGYCRAVYALWLEPFKERWAGSPDDKPRYADMAWGDSVKGEAITPEALA